MFPAGASGSDIEEDGMFPAGLSDIEEDGMFPTGASDIDIGSEEER